MEIERRPAVDETQRALYEEIVAGLHSRGPNGRILFSVSTDRLSEGKGDVYVALGLAKYLSRLGWGVGLWPMSQWGNDMDDDVDVVVSMLEHFVPGLMPESTARIAWARNWTDAWAELPYLGQFDAVWASSSAAAERLAAAYGRPVDVVPIAADAELFASGDDPVEMTVATSVNSWGNARQIDSVLGELAARVDVTMFGARHPDQSIPHAVHAGAVSYFGLPDAYRRSRIVIDDLIDQAKIYGNQNSRLFESISAGALPITNVRDGLAELGLESVPSYDSAADLIEQVRRLTSDPEQYQALLDGLQDVVTARHTFEVRAAETDPLIRAAVAFAAARGPRPELFRWMAAERAQQIFSSTISDQRQIELESAVKRVEQLEEELVAASVRLDEQTALAHTAAVELEAFRDRRIMRAEVAVRKTLDAANRAPARVRTILSDWSR
ncbi:glycosyltransferase [Herbiconiux sp. CPCC 205763]|uniref:Glycosyltransferase n=1 Tax=Herbiconiux aconitum TaxID=2970913 RepID=A0ABT2GK78_9MICO|nr:glycosyltransferase [Herbiconiux aconitum]MCS5716623.1 glycosyltransferase [Herbiconiux aconitum]